MLSGVPPLGGARGRWAVAAALLALWSADGAAQPVALVHPLVPSRLVHPLPSLAGSVSTAQSATASKGPNRTEWIALGVAFAAALTLDEDLGEIGLHERRGAEGLSSAANRVGRPVYFVPTLAGVYLAGRLLDRPGVASGAVHGSIALLASGAANGLGKALIGRGRPNRETGGGAFDFRPFNLTDNAWQSLPSGHAIVAFSLATSLHEEWGQPVASVLGYAVAATVGWSRVYENKHWVSDVVAGAAIGTFVTRYTIRSLHARGGDEVGAPSVTLLPNGIAVSIPVR